MAIFDPKPNTSVAFEQPVEQAPSTGMALAQLGTNFAESFFEYRQDRAEAARANQPDSDQLAMAQYQDTLIQAQAARTQGNTQRAEQLEREAALGLQRNGVSINENTMATYTAITGRPGDELLLSPEQVQLNQVRGSDEYQSAFLATYASGEDMTEQERDAAAISRVARQRGQSAALMDQTIAWTEGRRDAFFSVVSDFETSALGVLNLVAKERGFVPQDALRQAALGWSETKRALLRMRPEGVSDTQWNQLEDRIAQVDTELEVLQEMSSAEGIRAQDAADVAAGISMNENFTLGTRLVLQSALTNPEVMANLSAQLDLKELTESLLTDQFEIPTMPTATDSTGGTTGGTEAPGIFDNLPEDVTAADAEDNFKRAGNLGDLLGQTGPESVAADPTYRNEFLQTTYLAFGAMNQIGSENRRFVTADGINRVFNGKIVEGLRAAAQQNPTEAETVIRGGVQALDQQFAIAQQQLTNTLAGSYLRLSRDGRLVLDEGQILSDAPVDQVRMLKEAVDEFYGGDIVAYAEDRGRRAQGSFPDLNRQGFSSRIASGLTNARSQLASVNAINSKRQEFMGLLDDVVETEDPSDVALESSGATQVRGFEVVQGDTEFLNKVSEVSSELGVDPVPLLQAISFETIGTFDPAIKNPNSTATGLIQFLESTARGLGTTTAELRNMSRVDQMEFVKRYLEPYKGRLNNLGDIYMAIHWPAGVGKDSSYVMYERGSPEYEANSGLDQDGDGTVTRGEAVARVVESNRGGISATGLPASQDVRTTTLPPAGTGGNDVSQSAVEEATINTGMNGDLGMVTDATPQDTPQQTNTQAQQQATEEETDTDRVSRGATEQKTEQVRRLLRRLDLDPDEVPSFTSEEELRAAIESGRLKENDVYVLNGVIGDVQEEDMR